MSRTHIWDVDAPLLAFGVVDSGGRVVEMASSFATAAAAAAATVSGTDAVLTRESALALALLVCKVNKDTNNW